MLTRKDLAELSRSLEKETVLSVYLARENEDPGKGPEWLKRLEAALADLRSDLAGRTPVELPAFDAATDWVMSRLGGFGRLLPHEGWCAMATAERVWLAEALPFKPRELVRWRQGATIAPYVRALKVGRPAVLAVLRSLHADVYRYDAGELDPVLKLYSAWPPAEAGDLGMSKRASRASGMRGITRSDYVQRSRDENVRRHRKDLEEALRRMAGDDGVVVLGGTRKAVSAVHKDLEDVFPGRIAEAPEVAFDTPTDELLAQVRSAASRLTQERQERFLEDCADRGHGCAGWNETYRALAAGAVDHVLLARDLVESAPDDAERLVRLALAQGAEVEEVGGLLGERIAHERGGVVSRLRFVPASLIA